jgi:hypothetical protein
MQLTIPSGIADGVGTVIRQYMLSSIPAWKVVGMSSDLGVSVMSIPFVKETTADIIQSFNCCNFYLKSQQSSSLDFVKEVLTVSGALTISDLNRSLRYFEVDSQDSDDSVVLTVVDSALRIELFFRKACGCISYADNEAFLRSNNILSDDKCLPFASYHTTRRKFMFNIEHLDGDNSRITMTGDSDDVMQESVIALAKIFNTSLADA